jgi:3-hydroxyacyl-CoA dehydrogenase
MRAAGKEIDRNESASLFNIGDGVILLEFHSKVNALDEDIFKMIHRALERLDKNEFDAMVIGNQGEHFSAGANIFALALAAQNGAFDQIDTMIREGQNTMQALRYFHKPIVIAPFGMALGGGAELTMTASRVIAHSELYIGLVEMGVGIIPGWTGCKEMLRRVVNPVMQTPNAEVIPPLQKVFEQIALAKVSTSAMEARQMGFLWPADRIVMNKDRQLAEAKQIAIDMAEVGYTPLTPQKIYAAGRDVKAALTMGIYGLKEGRYATEHDAKIAKRLAHILCGGDLTMPTWVDEQYILDLEREAILSLAGEQKTLERIQHMLMNGKPLRN